MPDSSAIDNALMATLDGDAELHALLPDGVHFDQAPPYCKRFIVVSIFDSLDVSTFDGRVWESVLYMIKAVALWKGAPVDMQAAAARIDALLEDGALTIPGYVCAAVFREQRFRRVEIDDQNTNIRWFHRGGYYRVQAAVDEMIARR